jgi:hypothetical protein
MTKATMMPDESAGLPPRARHGAKPRSSRGAAATVLRVVAGALTVAAIIGGAGWLIRQGAKRRAHGRRDRAEGGSQDDGSSPPSGP